MSATAATVVETPPKTGESTVEKPRGEVKSKVESGDISGVFQIAQSQVDDELARGLGLSKIDEPNAAAVAGPEIIALKQADAEFENKAKTALGGLKSTIDTVGKPTETEAEKVARLNAVAEKAMAEGPQTEKDLVEEINALGAEKAKPVVVEKTPDKQEMKPVEAPALDTAETPATTTATEVMEEKVEEPPKEEAKELSVDAMMQKLDTDLAAEKKAFEEFQGTHGKAHTPLEQAYLDALSGRIASLEFEKQAHTNGDTGFEALAKAAVLKQMADKAEAAYQAMYDGFMNQPAEPHPDQAAVTEAAKTADEDDEQGYSLGSGAFSQSSIGGYSPSEREPRPKPTYEPSPMGPPQKPKGRLGKFVDSLKFWNYLSGKQQ